MERIEQFRRAVTQVIREYAQYKPSIGEIEVETVFDEENDHYEMLHIGWEGPKRVHGTVIHIDIRDGKIWIQFDGTSTGVAEDLVEAGVPRDQIILAWHTPKLRQHGSYEFGRIEETIS
jgi:hypothetical protein